MIVDTVNKVRSHQQRLFSERKMNLLKDKLNKIVDMVFLDNELHDITEEQFLERATRGEIMQLLEVVNMPSSFTAKDFFMMIDGLGQKRLTREHFVDSMLVLANGTEFHRDCSLLLASHQIR